MLGPSLFIAAWKRRKFDPAKKKRLMGVVRVTAYAMAVCAGLGVYSYRSAKADIGKSSIVIGRDLAKMSDLIEETTQVKMNGETVFIATAVNEDAPPKVLDRFEEHCKANPGALGDVWKSVGKMDAKTKDGFEKAGFKLLSPGVIRHGDAKEGVVLCLVKGSGTPDSMFDASRLFKKTHDLGTLGKLRYAYARITPKGQTLVLTAWTEDSFKLDAMFPRDGDAPGADPPEMPRPPESQRLMSIDVANTPFGAYVYRSSATPQQVIESYDKAMEAKGWTILDPSAQTGDSGLNHGYMKDGVMFTLSSGRGDDGATIVSIGEMAARPRGEHAER
jgi:hypothetical protein